MATTLTDPMLGRMVDGRYEVTSRIARGGMATVYLALDRRLDRQVAIKVMHPHLAEGHDVAARFRREARAAARLTHPGVVGVYDQGSEGETSYLTMEYVRGQNLRKVLRAEGALAVGDALDVVGDVLDALAAAHRADLVHRDIKPENVLVADDGRIKVADFGLARAVTEATAATTGTLLGTVAYLAPEIVTSGMADARADVYAAGVLLYELLTGSPPFSGETPIQIAYQHVNEDLPGVRERVPGIPVQVEELIGALSARDVQERLPHAGAAVAMLRHVRAGLSPEELTIRADVPGAEPGPWPDSDDAATSDHGATAATRSVRPTSHSGTISLPIGAVTAAQPRSEVDRPRRRRRRRRVTAVVITLLLLLGAGAAGWWYLMLGPGSYTPVPDVVGQEQARALSQIETADLRPVSATAHHDDVAEGLVISVDPEAGAELARQSTVTVTVSLGVRTVTMPDVAGMSQEEAVAAITDAGFSTETQVSTAYSADVDQGEVMEASPEPLAQVEHHTPVTLTVSNGREPITVHSVVGAAEDEAIAELEAAGAVAEVGERVHSDEVSEGLVISQDTQGDALRGDTVALVVSLGPELFEVPDVVGTSYRDAAQTLTEAGFEVARDDVLGGYFNTVRAQDVEPGSMVPRGTVISLTVV
ncbi:Stk1 family PASTA domain-containing Ser/Thr kinase [Pseudactinotalea sp. Z1739]|uniref:Stk1 family PASTA domain-containing Ser/Thr kinase n=1 Tax=Pseudactinotalea sp. Z1739 TaxID=3413028 RepID=UPI003C7A19D7